MQTYNDELSHNVRLSIITQFALLRALLRLGFVTGLGYRAMVSKDRCKRTGKNSSQAHVRSPVVLGVDRPLQYVCSSVCDSGDWGRGKLTR